MFGITTKILAYVCAALLTIVIVLYTMLKIESGKVETLTAQTAAYKITEQACKDTIEKSNASITSLQEEAKKRELEVLAAQEDIKEKVAKIESLAYKLMTYKAASNNVCLESNKLFDKYLTDKGSIK